VCRRLISSRPRPRKHSAAKCLERTFVGVGYGYGQARLVSSRRCSISCSLASNLGTRHRAGYLVLVRRTQRGVGGVLLRPPYSSTGCPARFRSGSGGLFALDVLDQIDGDWFTRSRLILCSALPNSSGFSRQSRRRFMCGGGSLGLCAVATGQYQMDARASPRYIVFIAGLGEWARRSEILARHSHCNGDPPETRKPCISG